MNNQTENNEDGYLFPPKIFIPIIALACIIISLNIFGYLANFKSWLELSLFKQEITVNNTYALGDYKITPVKLDSKSATLFIQDRKEYYWAYMVSNIKDNCGINMEWINLGLKDVQFSSADTTTITVPKDCCVRLFRYKLTGNMAEINSEELRFTLDKNNKVVKYN